MEGIHCRLERRSVGMRRVYATLRALVEVMELLSRDAPSEGVVRQIHEEVRKIKQIDTSLTGELTPYNIVPLDAPSLTNAIGLFPEVQAAISGIWYSTDFPQLPSVVMVSQQRSLDIFDLLQYVFGFQKDNVRNQRENVVLSITNGQSRFAVPVGAEPHTSHLPIGFSILKAGLSKSVLLSVYSPTATDNQFRSFSFSHEKWVATYLSAIGEKFLSTCRSYGTYIAFLTILLTVYLVVPNYISFGYLFFLQLWIIGRQLVEKTRRRLWLPLKAYAILVLYSFVA